MKDLFLSQVVSTTAMFDLLIMRFGPHKIKIPYQTGFEILNSMRMAAKMAMRYEGCKTKQWGELAELDKIEPGEFAFPRHHQFRRSNESPNIGEWSVRFEKALVVLQFDELTVKLHYADVLKMYRGMKAKLREAKAWAGDTSRTVRIGAHLTDAEENYKYGFN